MSATSGSPDWTGSGSGSALNRRAVCAQAQGVESKSTHPEGDWPIQQVTMGDSSGSRLPVAGSLGHVWIRSGSPSTRLVCDAESTTNTETCGLHLPHRAHRVLTKPEMGQRNIGQTNKQINRRSKSTSLNEPSWPSPRSSSRIAHRPLWDVVGGGIGHLCWECRNSGVAVMKWRAPGPVGRGCEASFNSQT